MFSFRGVDEDGGYPEPWAWSLPVGCQIHFLVTVRGGAIEDYASVLPGPASEAGLVALGDPCVDAVGVVDRGLDPAFGASDREVGYYPTRRESRGIY